VFAGFDSFSCFVLGSVVFSVFWVFCGNFADWGWYDIVLVLFVGVICYNRYIIDFLWVLRDFSVCGLCEN